MDRSRRFQRFLPTALLLAVFSAAALRSAVADRVDRDVPAPTITTFSELAITDRLEIHYESTGCAHHWRYRLTFHPSPARLTVVHEGAEWATIALSALEIQQLDALLAYYRLATKGLPGCTTTTTFLISQHRETARIGVEMLIDGTCNLESKRYASLRIPGLEHDTLKRLIDRAGAEKPWPRIPGSPTYQPAQVPTKR